MKLFLAVFALLAVFFGADAAKVKRTDYESFTCLSSSMYSLPRLILAPLQEAKITNTVFFDISIDDEPAGTL